MVKSKTRPREPARDRFADMVNASSNPRVILPVGPVTTLAREARVAPVPPAGYAQRWADVDLECDHCSR